MAEDDTDQVAQRVEALERRVQDLTARLARVEATAFERPVPPAVPTVLTPPPVFFRDTGPPVKKELIHTLSETVSGPPPFKPKVSSEPLGDSKGIDDLEYKIGLTGLLRGGAAVVVIGILYLVGLAISKGYITPQVQFIGEILLCLAFVTVGVVKRNERAEFGQLMTGIGSCGLYLSFVGGHVFKHLYQGETLVVLFVALSLLNLGYAWLRTSRSFLTIGMIGGFISAVLPMQQHKVVLDLGLHALILGSCALIVMKNRWSGMAVLLWVASICALIPVFAYLPAWRLAMGSLYVASIVSAVVYAYVWPAGKKGPFMDRLDPRKPEEGALIQTGINDPACALVPVILAAAALGAIAIDDVRHGGLHVILLSMACLCASWFFRGRAEQRDGFLYSGIGIAAALAPIGFHRPEACLIYGLLSVGLSLAALKWNPKALIGLSLLEWTLALVAYTAPWITSAFGIKPGVETAMLLGLMLSAAASAFAMHRSGNGSEQFAVLGAVGLVVGLIVPRIAIVWLAGPGGFLSGFCAFTVGALCVTLAASSLAVQLKWKSLPVIAWAELGLALMVFWLPWLDGAVVMRPEIETAMLAGFTMAAISCANANHRAGNTSGQTSVSGGVGILIGLMITRLAVIWLSAPQGMLTVVSASAVGALFVSYVASLATYRLRWNSLPVVAWFFLIVGAFCAAGTGLGQAVDHVREAPLLAASLGGLILVSFATAKVTDQGRDELLSVSVAATFLLFSRLAFLILTHAPFQMKGEPAVTIAWIVFAALVMAMGFRFQTRSFRFWGFAVFGATLVKVFALDLADLDPGIRVAILLVLGLTMIGGGYWYIRAHEAAIDNPTVPDPEIN